MNINSYGKVSIHQQNICIHDCRKLSRKNWYSYVSLSNICTYTEAQMYLYVYIYAYKYTSKSISILIPLKRVLKTSIYNESTGIALCVNIDTCKHTSRFITSTPF